MLTRDLGPLVKRRREINAKLSAGTGGGRPGSATWSLLMDLTEESAKIRAEIVATLNAVPFPVYAGGSLLKLTVDRQGYVECGMNGRPLLYDERNSRQIRMHRYEGGYVRPVGAAKGVA